MGLTKIGTVEHYYDKIGVAVIKLTALLKVGDKIKISGHDKEFSQPVESMQVEHQKIDQAKKGQSIGVKFNQPVKEGDTVFLEP